MIVDYKPPSRAPVARDRHRCTDCARDFLRATGFRPRIKTDPYGLAAEAVKRLKRKAPTAPTEAQIAAARKSALTSDPGNRALFVQPRCVDCDDLRTRRGRTITMLKHALRTTGADLKVNAARRVATIAGQVPTGVLERAAAGGVVIVDDAGQPVLPSDPLAALRVCYAGLVPLQPQTVRGKPVVKQGKVVVAPMRLGALGDERVALLKAIPKLIAQAPVGHPLTRRGQDVIDVALVREGHVNASDAMTRIFNRVREHHAKHAWKQIRKRVLSEEEAFARLDEGILIAVLTWEPLHESAAQLSTRCGWWVPRQLQIRTRVDRAIGSVQREDGSWSGGAVSLSNVLPKATDAADGAFVPHAKRYRNGGSAQSVVAESRDADHVETVRQDVVAALAALSLEDRELAIDVLQSGTPLTRAASVRGITTGVLRTRLGKIQAQLQAALASHATAEEEAEA